MSSGSRIFVITCPIPPGLSRELRIEITDRTATATTSHGFRHTFELPAEVWIEELDWQVHGDVLELRAPYREVEREVEA